MKRALGGGAHRGPVAITRQRRTLRFVQALLCGISISLSLFAGYEWGRSGGFAAARSSGAAGGPTPPPAMEVIALVVLALVALAGALVLQGRGGIRIPTPARLEELAGRAEAAAVERAEQVAGDAEADDPATPG